MIQRGGRVGRVDTEGDVGIADVRLGIAERTHVARQQGLAIRLGVKITKVSVADGVSVEYTDAEGKSQNERFDKLMKVKTRSELSWSGHIGRWSSLESSTGCLSIATSNNR